MYGLVPSVEGLAFRIQGAGSRVWGLGLTLEGFLFRNRGRASYGPGSSKLEEVCPSLCSPLWPNIRRKSLRRSLQGKETMWPARRTCEVSNSERESLKTREKRSQLPTSLSLKPSKLDICKTNRLPLNAKQNLNRIPRPQRRNAGPKSQKQSHKT